MLRGCWYVWARAGLRVPVAGRSTLFICAIFDAMDIVQREMIGVIHCIWCGWKRQRRSFSQPVRDRMPTEAGRKRPQPYCSDE
jgi:Zn ribbon nucleic-acid-binding protein